MTRPDDSGGAVSHRVPRLRCDKPGIIARARSRVSAAAPSVLASGLGRNRADPVERSASLGHVSVLTLTQGLPDV